ncbi:olfactory receptor 4K3-like [Alligator sinensis]|uniref:Olfactory receptor n=1 Tax=Alligator sinensis TaxID=38654 RepID=A0A1U7SAK1_ALLSI|nr:olfactory receptor 4K3-like [Alligator sinensis]
MERSNSSVVSEFILLGLSPPHDLQLPFFVAFTLLYMATVLGNLLILLTIISSPHLLHCPMFFLLYHLSFLDLCLASFATPRALLGFLSHDKAISFQGCMAQIFFLHIFTGSEMLLLTAMAYDRYVAICQPLHYASLMSLRHCLGLVVVSWSGGFLHATIQLSFMINLPFCGPNHVDSFFCDIPLVMKLACTNTDALEVMMVANSGLISLVSFLALLVSYSFILSAVRSRSSAEGTSKAFSTCSSHLTVATLFFGPCLFIYLRPFIRFPTDKVLSVFYTAVTPLLNPIIYTLRNKEVKAAMRRLWTKRRV